MLQMVDLVKTYGDGAAVRAVDGINLEIQMGEFVALVGPSGSGKTTLLNLIGTLDQPTSGKVVIEGVDTSTLRGDGMADFRRTTIGFIFQMFNLIPTLTAWENVMLPLTPYRRGLKFNLKDHARELLQKVGMEKRLQHLPGQLSGGEQQRVAIARALINAPRIILADEPTGNLDSKSGEEVVSLLESLVREQGLTLVLVTHNAEIAGQADRVIHLQDGRLV
ncbi:MAG: ABC transporter ATP-binding protein [Anaerolineaceae bacterium]|nr:ABC transporter ATP-binding protein [Anaerolineaceae bacterium]